MQKTIAIPLKWLFMLSLLAILFGSSRNLLVDSFELVQRAEVVSYRDEPAGCAAEEMRNEWSFYAQTYDSRTHRRRSVHLGCLRELILRGEYECTCQIPYGLNALPSAAPGGPRSPASSAPSGAVRRPPGYAPAP
jgi:hypothetical protein